MVTNEEEPAIPAHEKPAASAEPHAPPFRARWYWATILVSLATLMVAVGFRDPYLPGGIELLRQTTISLSVLVIVVTLAALMRQGRVLHRVARGTRHAFVGVVEGIQQREEAAAGRVGQFFSKLAKAATWLVLLPLRILVWAWYAGEKTFWNLQLIVYDVLYYPLYLAWILAHFAVRTALRLAWFVLRVAWKIIRLPLLVWPVIIWWRKKRGEILTKWRVVVKHRRHVRQVNLDKMRRLRALKGEDPDKWQADYELRRGFPLPHPEKARRVIRKRIIHIRAVQRARKEGRPPPRWGEEAGKESGPLGRFRKKPGVEAAAGPAATPEPTAGRPGRKAGGKEATAEPSSV